MIQNYGAVLMGRDISLYDSSAANLNSRANNHPCATDLLPILIS